MTNEDDIRLAVGAWLRRALEDAERRGMPELKPLLEGLAESTVALRKADWNEQVALRRQARPRRRRDPGRADEAAAGPLHRRTGAPHRHRTGLGGRAHRGVPGPNRARQRPPQRLHHGARGPGARPGPPRRRGDRRRALSRAAPRHPRVAEGPDRSGRHADHRGVAGARRLRRAARTPRSPPVCVPPARSSSASATCTSSRSGRRARTPRSGRCTIPGTPSDRPADRAAGRPPRSSPGMGLASVGTDTGGSIRIPAAVCGCVGLKPTYGELPCDGIIPLSRSLDHVGPARADRGRRLAALPRDGRATRTPRRCPPAGAPPASLRLGLLGGYFMDVLADGVAGLFSTGALAAAAGGHDASSIAPSAHAADIADRLPAPAAARGVRLPRAGARAPAPGAYTPPVRQRLEMGRYVLAEDYVTGARPAPACCGARWTPRSRAATRSCCRRCRSPRNRSAAPTLDVGGRSHPVRALMLRLTQLFDITGHPAISLPCGHSQENLPVGLQLVGRRGRTAELLEIAAAVEAVHRAARLRRQCRPSHRWRMRNVRRRHRRHVGRRHRPRIGRRLVDDVRRTGLGGLGSEVVRSCGRSCKNAASSTPDSRRRGTMARP